MSSSLSPNQINEEFRDSRSPNLSEIIERSLNKLGFFKGVIVPVILLIVWEIASKSRWVAPNLLPAPSTVLATINDLAKSGDLWKHIGITAYRVAIGFVIGVAIATVLGAITGYSKILHDLVDPLLQSLRSIPSLAWVPLFLLWMGIQETPRIALIAVGVFFPVYLSLMSGIRSVDRKLVEVGKIYRLSAFQLIKRVFLPATIPDYIVGLRSGLGLGWMFVVAAELTGASQGLGYLLVDGQTTGRPELTIASILLFAILGKLTDGAIALSSKKLLHWRDAYGQH
ncbi:MAG: ABC transporter permease [Pseudanabaena sp.]|jgi:sulfonate transport system permease protein|uniref:ABC transporter permease n=1 Tax=Pseudanabaena mucicola TaxID=71190 RepID=UPI0025766473|nr:ABC transporter permease [Pseudanabaena mucicola]MCA6574185.1 ABC transporter permease [Pseudanabaena sp. M53BS1SP1A06MG]MCA6580597.1 ABC transporter permease [Pseudanabaena sp. M34BS1SP1A06MG]MCA6593353.1 ABC transporter permease [Pseudanabaena sp. M38BS1SP1A06MG]MCA6600328.1 ABC transporter permease [Pseudanabaena sp. M57BS1SP1A06MG]MCA6611741.1 ABC transporter permease [Pseudanabaena sp. M158S2SP1A06QC]